MTTKYTYLDGIETNRGTARFPHDTFQGEVNLRSSWLQVEAAHAHANEGF